MRASSSLILLLAIGFAAHASPDPGTFEVTVPIEYGDFVAIRVNLTDVPWEWGHGVNLTIAECATGNESLRVAGNGRIVIRDGSFGWPVPRVQSSDPALVSVNVAAGSEDAIVAVGRPANRCSEYRVGSWPFLDGDKRVVIVYVHGGGAGIATMQAVDWGPVVESWDIHVGKARFKALTEFETSVGAYTGLLPEQTETTVLARETASTTRDTVGWFWPIKTHAFSSTVEWSCAINGANCPGERDSNGWLPFKQQGPAEWEFVVAGSVQADASRHVALGFVELPDDHYLN